jgi:hypothetical protein
MHQDLDPLADESRHRGERAWRLAQIGERGIGRCRQVGDRIEQGAVEIDQHRSQSAAGCGGDLRSHGCACSSA